MKIYVASSWRNEHQQRIVCVLRKAGHEVYDFKHPTEQDAGFSWSEIDPNWQEWSIVKYIGALAHDKAKLGFNRDFDAMKAADACVLVLPCGRSAHLEAGWMKGVGKKVYAFVPRDYKMEPELMYKMLDGIASTTRGLLSLVIKMDHISYDKFREWCNMRACDGRWGIRQALCGVEILEEMRHVSFWKRRRIWRERYEQQALSVIACVEAAQILPHEEGEK